MQAKEQLIEQIVANIVAAANWWSHPKNCFPDVLPRYSFIKDGKFVVVFLHKILGVNSEDWRLTTHTYKVFNVLNLKARIDTTDVFTIPEICQIKEYPIPLQSTFGLRVGHGDYKKERRNIELAPDLEENLVQLIGNAYKEKDFFIKTGQLTQDNDFFVGAIPPLVPNGNKGGPL
jgi:hypothetical protein